MIQDTSVVDDDASCFRAGQLKLNCIESSSHISRSEYDVTVFSIQSRHVSFHEL